MSGVSISWANFNACPALVFFNADEAGSYAVNFTLTDANNKSYVGSISLTVVAGATECQEEAVVACDNKIFNDSSCFETCPPEADGYRAQQACQWYCSAANAYAGAQCGYQFGCVSKYTEYKVCTSKCNFQYAACLNAIESDDPDFPGNCPADQGGCLGPCMALLD